jgi:hypothetical protein
MGVIVISILDGDELSLMLRRRRWVGLASIVIWSERGRSLMVAVDRGESRSWTINVAHRQTVRRRVLQWGGRCEAHLAVGWRTGKLLTPR